MAPDLDSSHHPLTDHFAWLERLAQRLADDPDQADDLVQETLLAAVRGKNVPLRAPRAFLRTVLQRALWRRRRADRRRRDREALSEAPAPAPATDEIVERAEVGQELTRHVLALNEPYRTTILLRYAEGLTPLVIAERLGLPAVTVKSHLARGRAQLRENWRRSHPDDDTAWLASLAPLFPRGTALPIPSTPASLPLGTLLMHTKFFAAAAVAAGCAALIWYGVDAPGVPDRPADQSVARAADDLNVPQARPKVVVPTTTNIAARSVASAPSPNARPTLAAQNSPAPTQAFRGRVVDATPRPMARVRVTFRSNGAETGSTLTDSTGRFEFDAPAGPGTLQVTDPELVNLFVFNAPAVAGANAWLVVAAHRGIAGKVVDGDRRPVAGARVEFALPTDFRARFDAVFDSATELRSSATTDAGGRFAMVRVPMVQGSTVRALLDGFEGVDVEAPGYDIGDLELVLRRDDAGEQTLAGRVVDVHGVPVSGALVSLGGQSAASAADGTFRLDRSETPDAKVLRAIAPGALPGRFEATIDPGTGEHRFPGWIELRLGQEPMELAGRVVDQHGEPYAGLELWIDDPAEFGIIEDDVFAQVEFLTAPEASTYGTGSDAYFRSVTTDGDGRFLIQGLLERSYTLKLLDRTLLYTEVAGAFAAGDRGVRIVLHRPDAGSVEGRVVSRAEEPVAGARVDIRVHAFRGVSRIRDRVTTDAEGYFRFADVAGDRVGISVRGQGIVPDSRTIDRSPDPIEVVVDVLCHFKVDLSTSNVTAARIRVRDGQGQSLGIYDIGAGGYTIRNSFELTDGRSGTLSVPESARTLVLEEENGTSTAVELRLEPGRLVMIAP